MNDKAEKALFKPLDEYEARLKREIRQEFQPLMTVGFDQLHVIQLTERTKTVYKRLDDFNRAEYRRLARHGYDWALVYYAEMYGEDVRKLTEKLGTFDTYKFVNELLSGYNPITQYVYDREVERKRMRLEEAILTAVEYMDDHQRRKAVKKAADLWFTQSDQYGIDTLIGSLQEAYGMLGVTKLRWNTMEDSSVCAECNKLHGKVFTIRNYPPRQHYKCRCYPTPA